MFKTPITLHLYLCLNNFFEVTYYDVSDTESCSGDNYWATGYASSLKAIGDGDLCETDYLTYSSLDGVLPNKTITTYTKWVQVCGKPSPTLSDGIYQYMLPCIDKNCTKCADVVEAAVFIDWSYFDSKPYPTCMEVWSFNATSTDPATEFADSTPNMTMSSELFGSEEVMMQYWDVFVNNSCIMNGDKSTESSDSASSSFSTMTSISTLYTIVVQLAVASVTIWG